jgi:hypothetical protein
MVGAAAVLGGVTRMTGEFIFLNPNKYGIFSSF